MILARYLVKEVLLNTMAVTLVLVLVGITNQVVVYLARAASGVLPVGLVLEVVGLNIPYLLSFMLPFGFFLGVLLAYGRLYADAEMTVMQACGFSIARLVWVTVVASIGVTILCAILTLWTTPASMRRMEISLAEMRADVLANFIKPGRFQAWEDGQYVVYIAGVNEDDRTVKEVFIAEQPQENTTDHSTIESLSVLTAETGYLWEDPVSKAEYIVLNDGQRYLGAPGSAAYTLMGFKEYGVRLPSQNLKIRKPTRTQPTWKFFGSSDPDELSELQWRFTLPLSILVLAILSVPLSRVSPRKGKFSTIFPALVVILIYSNCLMLTRNWVESGWLNPLAGLLWPHLVALGFAAILIAQANTLVTPMAPETSLMRILSSYIGRTILFTTLLATFLIVSIDMLFSMVNELRAVGEGEYTMFGALQYILLTLPGRLYFIFPMACLVGALMGLGLLAGHSELIVMRSSGVSILQITMAVLRAALILVLAITLFGEFVVPYATKYAEIYRESAITGNQTVTTPQGTWIRDGHNFIRVKQILPDGELLSVIRYEFNEQHELQSATYAERAQYSTQQKQWQMFNVKQTTLGQEGVTVLTVPEQTWKADIKPSLVNILIEQPDSLSIMGLINYIQYLRDNQLRTQEYALALWKKFWQPIATLVMIFIAIPVILGPLRSATMGLRLLTGVLLGFGFYILNQLFGPLSLVYSSFPPILAASLPSLLFALGGFLLLRRVR